MENSAKTDWQVDGTKDKSVNMGREVEIRGKKVLCEILPPEKTYMGRSSHGTSTKIVVCPFCKEQIEVYIWSFAGCGKICECGARLGDWHCYKPINMGV